MQDCTTFLPDTTALALTKFEIHFTLSGNGSVFLAEHGGRFSVLFLISFMLHASWGMRRMLFWVSAENLARIGLFPLSGTIRCERSIVHCHDQKTNGIKENTENRPLCFPIFEAKKCWMPMLHNELPNSKLKDAGYWHKIEFCVSG